MSSSITEPQDPVVCWCCRRTRLSLLGIRIKDGGYKPLCQSCAHSMAQIEFDAGEAHDSLLVHPST